MITREVRQTGLSTETQNAGWRGCQERVKEVAEHLGRQQELGGGRRGIEGGNGTRARLNSSKIERHFHMYILQMYIDTIR